MADIDAMPIPGLLYRWEDNPVSQPAIAENELPPINSDGNRVLTTSVAHARLSYQVPEPRRHVSEFTRKCAPSITRPCS